MVFFVDMAHPLSAVLCFMRVTMVENWICLTRSKCCAYDIRYLSRSLAEGYRGASIVKVATSGFSVSNRGLYHPAWENQ